MTSLGVLLLVLVLWKTNILPAGTQKIISDVANTGLNEADLEMQTRNYYREVSDVNIGRFAGLGKFLHEIGLKAAPPVNEDDEPGVLSKTSIVHQVHAYLPWEMKPNEEIRFQKHPLITNRWGMRDEDCEQKKPAGVFRIALVGASNSMGFGVAVENTYAELVEDELNARFAGKGHERFEVLNFSVGGYDLTDRLFVATEKIPAFEPDMIIVVVLLRDFTAAVYQRVAERFSQGIAPHYSFIEAIAQEAGIQPGGSATKLQQKLRPYRARLLKGCADEMHALSQREGVPVAALLLNLVTDPPEQRLYDAASICEGAGLPTLRIFEAYSGHSAEQVHLSPTDRHPNVLGHRLIADDVLRQLLDHPQLGPMIRREE